MIWVIVTVQHDGVLAVTQQMTRLTELGTSPTSGGAPLNPFSEPALPSFPGVNAPGRPAPPEHTVRPPASARP